MSEKVLQEFSAKILKAKNLYEATKNQCDVLRREKEKLEREYKQIYEVRKEAELQEENLKYQYENSKKSNKEESEKCAREVDELNNLRSLKKKLKREKDIYESEMMKNSLALEELVKQRVQLQQTAKQYSDKLENITAERAALQDEYVKTNSAIEDYTLKIKELKEEMDTMKGLISQSVLAVGNIPTSNQNISQNLNATNQHMNINGGNN
ncbi:hypothetical protein TTHERM_00688760 (macronuclear) [Tetrahymena thermophila SB210]|uniref:Uncharacterized protein n=1 Tax=Tetrahymena thermophila (strain SB210) TaxID=312017 RepID=I7LXX8_TETTS|nr:hypothetical protein TTHERM_00688760 [Tetrahymena thermophila SB210]EAS06736.1 hypothetical protein TTHERM_00688760 [Tetrahymena thermophila SB210]|eukprot:XP_001026978.1 hypothetical protein TTHERM_00688760 [Tetrahymena thermophila SB210]